LAGDLPTSWREAKVVVIPKAGRASHTTARDFIATIDPTKKNQQLSFEFCALSLIYGQSRYINLMGRTHKPTELSARIS